MQTISPILIQQSTFSFFPEISLLLISTSHKWHYTNKIYKNKYLQITNDTTQTNSLLQTQQSTFPPKFHLHYLNNIPQPHFHDYDLLLISTTELSKTIPTHPPPKIFCSKRTWNFSNPQPGGAPFGPSAHAQWGKGGVLHLSVGWANGVRTDDKPAPAS